MLTAAKHLDAIRQRQHSKPDGEEVDPASPLFLIRQSLEATHEKLRAVVSGINEALEDLLAELEE